MAQKVEQFNMIISGVGGQGLITLLQLVAETAILEGYDVKTSELHGLSQRGGSVEVHIKFGKKVWSPIVAQGRADLILALESQEALRGAFYAGKQTKFLINQYQTPTLSDTATETQVLNNLKKITSKIAVIPAAEICEKEIGTQVTAGVYLISYATHKNLIPLKPSSIQKTIKKLMPEKYLDINLKTFKIAGQ